MDQFNKAISFILGLVVVAVFIAIASGRINLSGKLPFSSKSTITPTPTPVVQVKQKQTSLFGNLFNFNKQKVTPTPTVTPKKAVPTTTIIGNNKGDVNNSTEYHKYSNIENVSSIPDTGPALLFPLAFSSLLGGIYLKKKR